MRVVRWVLFALGFLLGSALGNAARSETPDEDLLVLPAPDTNDDPHVLSGWVGVGGLRDVSRAAPAGVTDSAACDELCRGGWLRESDHRFDCFISPMSNPVYFEDPRTLTEARVIFMNQKLPNRAPLAGGDFQFLGVQARAAVTDRLSAVMTKSGFFMGGAPTPIDDGWSDVSLGLKYNLLADPAAQQVVSIGANYELPVGSARALQGRSGGEFHTYITGAAAVRDNSHIISAFGWRMPGDAQAQSQLLHWSNHWDTRLTSSGLYVLAEATWYHYLNSGEANPSNVEGLDMFNLGSTDVAGNDIVTGAAGLKLKPSGQREIGLAYELPLTDRRDYLGNRLTFDMIFRY